METQIKQIRNLEELDSLTIGEKIEVIDSHYAGMSWLSRPKVMTYYGKKEQGYSFLLGRTFEFIEGIEIDELSVKKEKISFDENGILHTNSWMVSIANSISVKYQEKLNLIQMGK